MKTTKQQPPADVVIDPAAPISHAAPLVPAVILRADGDLSLQMVRMPADVNMHRKAGLKTPTGGFGRVHACAGLWPGWYLWARPPPAEGGVDMVVGPAVFLALDAPPATAGTVLDPCPIRTTVDAVQRMRAGEAPPPMESAVDDVAEPVARDSVPPPPLVAPPLPEEEEAADEAPAPPIKQLTKGRKKKLTADNNIVMPAAAAAVTAAAAPKKRRTPAAAAPRVPKKKALAVATAAPQTLEDFSVMMPEPYDDE